MLNTALASAITYVEQETIFDFKETCTMDGSPCNASAICNLSVKYPDNTYLISFESMTNQNNGDFNYTFNETQTSTLGEHGWDIYCCQAGECDEGHGEFTITPNGLAMTTPTIITYLIILGFFVIFLLVSLYMFIHSGANDNTYKVRLKKLWWFGISYILFIPILFILWQIADQFLTSITVVSVIFRGLFYIWTLGFIAVFVFSMFYVLRTIYIQKEVQRLINKGWPEDEARNRVKRRRR
jgi:hypothetical protein